MAPAAAAEAAPATALDAANALAATPAPQAPEQQALTVPMFTGNIPFGAAPNEPGFNLPRTGFLGWVRQQQQDFYLALEKALAALKTDWTGFWVLGLLSFLYGIFHAAGPGHGKVVISSYVLANEAQVRRGVFLSFLAAMLQSLVAIGFVLVAASLLGMTAMAMSNAANWIGVLSYGLVMAARPVAGRAQGVRLGPPSRPRRTARSSICRAWRAAIWGRPPMRWPREGRSSPHSGRSRRGRMHLAACRATRITGTAMATTMGTAHAHVVTPGQIRGGWREQLGVVLSVGIRPCSGALIVLAFALSQGLLFAGIVAVLLMGVGTAITTGVLAALAVGFKGLARGLAGADNKFTGALVWWAELLAAVGVFAFGLVLLLASV